MRYSGGGWTSRLSYLRTDTGATPLRYGMTPLQLYMATDEYKRFWTLSNAISLLRAVLTLPAVWLIALGRDYVWEAFVVFAAMIASDWIDGYVARRRGEISRWGKILDPLADKVGIGAIAIALVCFKNLPVWLLAAVLVRDAAIFFGGVYLVRQCGVVLKSNIWGKATSLALSGLLLAYFWEAEVLKPALLGLSVALLGISLISYARRFFAITKN